MADDDWHGNGWKTEKGRLKSDLSWFLDDSKNSIETWMERGRRISDTSALPYDPLRRAKELFKQQKTAEQAAEEDYGVDVN